MKKVFALFIAVALITVCIVLLPMETKAATVESGTCGANLTWTLDDQGTLTISGSGNMTNYASQGAPWFSIQNRTKLKKVIIKEGVTSIGNYAFANLSAITEIITPSTVAKIGEHAFVHCGALQSFVIPNGVRTIPKFTFSNCSSLTSIVIPSSVSSFGDMAFTECSSLEYIIIPDGVTTLPYSMFKGCSGLEYISIPSTVTRIHPQVFDDCGNLWDIYYAGTSSQYKGITIDSYGNEQLKSATIHYSSKAPCRTHAYGNYTNVSGTQHSRTCANCGYVETGSHSWNSGSVTKAASCKETGVKTYSCTACNATKTETIAKTTDHKYGNWTKVNDTTHKHTCSVCQKEETANHSWNGGNVTKKATCKEAGVKTYSCTDCSITKTETIAKTNDHKYSGWTMVSDSQHQHTCSVCQKVETVNHTWDSGKVTKSATCKEAGIKTYTCTGCKTTKTETIAKLTTHTYDHACDTDCNVCGVARTTTHNYKNTWSKDKTNHWHECSVCKDKKDVAAHTPGAEATETSAQKCTVCGYVIKAALGHTHNYANTWTTDENGHWYACDGCEEKGSYAAHTPGPAATTTTDQTCTVCGYVLAKAIGETETPSTPASTPAPLPAASVPAPTLPKGDAESNPASVILIVVMVAVVLIGGGIAGIIIWKKKH